MSYYCSYKLKVDLDPNCNAPLSTTKEKMCSYVKAARTDYNWMNEAFDEDGNTIQRLSGAE